MRWALVQLLVVATAAHPALAQRRAAESAATRVRLTVFDSLTRTPLSGARLLLQREDGVGSATALFDASGRVEIELLPGRWLAGIVHPRFDSLGVTLPPRRLEVASKSSVRLTIATPSARTLFRSYCGTDASDPTGVLMGYVHDARTQAAFVQAVVIAQWTELAVEGRVIQHRRPSMMARTDSSGWYILCGVPAGDQILAWASNDATTTGMVSITSPAHGLTRLDFRIDTRTVKTTGAAADSAAVPARREERLEPRFDRGLVLFPLAVRDESGRALAGARARISGRQDRTTDERGIVMLDSLQAGTQMLEVRAVGFLPIARIVDVAAKSDAPDTVTLASLKSVLDTVQIIARTVYDADGNGFAHRRTCAIGAFVTSEEIAQRRPLQFTDLLGGMSGVQVQYRFGAPVITMSDPVSVGRCSPEVYIDGWQLQRSDVGDIDLIARTDRIAGVEVYNSPSRTPAQFHSPTGSCGSVVIWLRRQYKPPKRPADGS